jgi:hypothetical protein
MAYSKNIDRIGYNDLEGRAGFKLAMKEADGHFFLYVASMWEPGLSILEVTDPENPRFVRFIAGPPNTWCLQVQVAGDRMITNLEPVPAGWGSSGAGEPQDGFVIWDLTDPVDPRQLGTWRSGNRGTHRNFFDGGRYVHAAASLPGFIGRIYAAVDIDDPEQPRIAGKWWHPGQNQAAGETFTDADQHKRVTGRPQPTEAIALHGAAYRSGDRVYCPWSRGGMVILDISDITAPAWVSTLSAYPPLGSTCGMHTVIPVPERNLAIVNDEALNERRDEPLNFAGLVDISDERDPMLVSLFPVPEDPPGAPDGFSLRGGRFGPHNQHQRQGQDCLADTGDLVYLTYFNAGLQVFDISDVHRPRNVAYYIPDEPATRRGPKPTDLVVQVEDVLVDRRSNIFISEKNSGITVLRPSE